MCGGLGPRVDYRCPQDGVDYDKGAIRVDVFFWVPRRTMRADVGRGGGCSGILSWVWKGKGPCMLVCCLVGRGS